MDEQQLQQQIEQLVQAAMQGDQQATQQIQQIMQAAQQGDQQAVQIAQMIQQVAQQMQQQMQQQQARTAKFGAKLNYIKQLKGQCPDGYKLEYYRQGGQLCKRCAKAQEGSQIGKAPSTIAEQFKIEAAKCGKKMKKKEDGGSVEVEKCGGKPKLRKKACGGPMKSSLKKKK